MANSLIQKTDFVPAPANIAEAYQQAQILAKSRLIPSHFQGKPDDVFVAIWWSHNLGLPAIQGLQNIAVINGRPCLWGDVALAICKASGLIESYQEIIEGEGDQMVAKCSLKRKDEQTPYYSEFSVQDAQLAGLWGKAGPWRTYPKRMLIMRARGFLLRSAFPDRLMGLEIAEEVQDIPTVQNGLNSDMEALDGNSLNDDMPKAVKAPKTEVITEKAEKAEPKPKKAKKDIEIEAQAEVQTETISNAGSDLSEIKKQLEATKTYGDMVQLWNSLNAEQKAELKDAFAEHKKEVTE